MPKPMTVTVADLKDQVGVPGPHPSLYCDGCGATYSAHKGDYFMLPASHVFRCCGGPNRLVFKRTVFTEVSDV